MLLAMVSPVESESKPQTDEPREPGQIRSGSGCGYAPTKGMKIETADGIDGGLAQDGGLYAGS
jgi:hypothetical protein